MVMFLLLVTLDRAIPGTKTSTVSSSSRCWVSALRRCAYCKDSSVAQRSWFRFKVFRASW